MRFVMFYHSLVSDWNHGNAHFLRGVATELLERGHQVAIYEPEDGWSYSNLVAEHGQWPIRQFRENYPHLKSARYERNSINLAEVLDGADVVIVHEWTSRDVIQKIGEHRQSSGRYRLFFHDTHHRSITAPETLGVEHLSKYDGALVFGESLRREYLRKEWSPRVWVWHEAADTRTFTPRKAHPEGDLVWIGNWGDDERTAELQEFLLAPTRELKLRTRVHGVRYPAAALEQLQQSGACYSGWVPNFLVPETFARFRFTVHVPRRPYCAQLPGVPTIRVFEALACGIPLICAPWDDCEHLFTAGSDYLVANNRAEMIDLARELLNNEKLRLQLAEHGLKTIEARHTCRHRVDELLEILHQ
jgi:spore maturation protein CgeB